jgi:hypothetical protein
MVRNIRAERAPERCDEPPVFGLQRCCLRRERLATRDAEPAPVHYGGTIRERNAAGPTGNELEVVEQEADRSVMLLIYGTRRALGGLRLATLVNQKTHVSDTAQALYKRTGDDLF